MPRVKVRKARNIRTMTLRRAISTIIGHLKPALGAVRFLDP
jgi:hypothetical protein